MANVISLTTDMANVISLTTDECEKCTCDICSTLLTPREIGILKEFCSNQLIYKQLRTFLYCNVQLMPMAADELLRKLTHWMAHPDLMDKYIPGKDT